MITKLSKLRALAEWALKLVSARTVRIIGGDYSVKGQFPYLVLIQTSGQHHCGGSIVADQYILTAAHCLINDNNIAPYKAYRVVFDSVDLNNYEGFEVDAVAAYAFSKYDPKKTLNDIAILKLKQRLPLGGNSVLQKIRLPRSGDSYAGRTAVISGCGYTSIEVEFDPTTRRKVEGRDSSDNKLKYAYVDLMSNSDCMEKNNYLIYPGQICGQV
ncbi:hypothetical protein TSAR_000943 [Trichomalopsis sarcophagae]|uniref:Peptidase S1 domain-containing protein n=1 Tax=Trichomalopsis sarcophagae TaxID=543379 RepID=A0A232F224_9HYME|nr:hypothetical protein TSAR_000943 [Trichomalopsis sarcophagae]